MNNDEIKMLLRELKESSDASEGVKGRTVKIDFGEEPKEKKDSRRKKKRTIFGKRAADPSEPEINEEGIPDPEHGSGATPSPGTDKPETESDRPETESSRPETERNRPETESSRSETDRNRSETERGRPKMESGRPKTESGRPEADEAKTVQFADDDAFRDTDAGIPSPPGKSAKLFPRFFGHSGEVKEEKKEKKTKDSRGTKHGSSGRSIWQNLKFDCMDFFEDLKRKGIAGKELAMIGAGFCLLILIILIICSAVFQENKSVNVTSDEGLRVTVEQEPDAWCSLGTVELGLHTSKAIQSVTVNGSQYQSEDGNLKRITLEADSETLQLMVVTEDTVLNAAVEIPMIDSEKPMLSVSQQNGQVTLSAVDSRSGVAGIYYGTVNGFSDIPAYQLYTGPFGPEQGKLYYYYAVDAAGNRTIPLSTNMEAAEALSLNMAETVLFPGDSFKLTVTSEPAASYYNNLKLTNRDPSIVSLNSDGTVTALQEGTAVIEAQADGLPSVSCQVEVKSETTVTISAVGDCTLGTDINFSSSNSFSTVQAMYGNSYFFQNVRSILSEDDITFANFEGTLTTLDTRADKEYAFKGDPSYTEILKDGSIEAVTLANNHSSDYGEQSLTDTKQYLKEAGIDYCTGDEIILKEVNGVKVGLIGIYVLDEGISKETQVKETIAKAKEQGASLIIIAFHWGSEKSDTPDEIQQSLAHTAVDSGADLVVGHHPHVLQGIEQYNGKYIVYSLGNFCFGGNSTPSDMDTMIFQQTFTVNKAGVKQDSQITIIPCSISSDTTWNNYQPTPAAGDAAAGILARINELSASFGQSFS